MPISRRRKPLMTRSLTVAGRGLVAARSFAVPMLKEDELIGAIGIYRQEVRPFTDKQIELVKNFARQAVIAIENTRLLSELRQRTDDLAKRWSSRPRPRRCLRVITSSPVELQPVFDTMVENAARICDANWRVIRRFAKATFSAVAAHMARSRTSEIVILNTPLIVACTGSRPSLDERDNPYPRRAGGAGNRLPTVVDFSNRWCSDFLAVPMLREGEPIGAIFIYRQEVRPFTEKQIELVADLRRPGRYRHREHPPVRSAAAHARANPCSSRQPPPMCSR